MKKVLLTTAIVACASVIFAQVKSDSAGKVASTNTVIPANPHPIKSKKGEMFLPQAGDWAISLDATPFLKYFGSFLSSSGATAPTAQFLNSNQTITGKYFIDDHTAYRALVRLGFNTGTESEEIPTTNALNSTTFPLPYVEDQRSISNHYVGLGFGIEKRKGKTRLQGYYGVEVLLYISGSDTTYKYGNSYDVTNNPTPGYWNWTTNGLSYLSSTNPRPTENEPGSTFGIGVLGFIGVEYFVLPKISIGGEFTWGLEFESLGQGTLSLEEINPTNNTDQAVTYKIGGATGFSADNGLNQAFGSGTGSLNITVHF